MKRSILWGWCASSIGFAASGFLACAENATSLGVEVPEEEHPVPPVDSGLGNEGDGGIEGSCSDAASQDGCVGTKDCTAVDFCATAFPVTRQTSLNAIWGSGPDDVWAVGTRGTILHGDGTAFIPVASGTTDIYLDVWGSGKDDVWIINPTTPLRSSGLQNGKATFTEQKGSTWLSASRVWTGLSLSASSVWIAGDYSEKFGVPASSFWRFGQDADGGAAWNSAPACPAGQYCNYSVRKIWGTSSENIWAVGNAGQAYRMDDASTGHWTQLDTRSNNTLLGVWGTGPSDVWAVGVGGTILHSTTTTGPWTEVPSPTKRTLRALWGSGPSDIWAVGDGGTILHYDGTSWSHGTIGLDPGDPVTSLLGIWGSGPDDVWIVGEGIILHHTVASRRHP
ncbi:MAG: hypothetical protein K0S65_3016 [Labilithrix sp.]|nr:hypothetical protein [Labilithrix sp.]